MIRPASWFAFGIHVCPAEEKRLYDEVLQLQFASLDSLVNPLVTRIESTRVPAHRDESRFFLNGENSFGVGERVRNRDFDLNVFARPHALDGLFGVDLGGGSQDNGFNSRLGKR